MKKLLIIAMLSLFSFAAFGQTISRYPEYQRVYEDDRQECREVVVQDRANVTGAVVGAIVGYAVGRELDRDTRGYYGGYYGHGHRGYVPHRGGYYRDHGGYYYGPRYESRVGRVGGAVAGGYIGSRMGRGDRIQRICDTDRRSGYYREVLVGYRVVYRYNDGTTREVFEPIR